MRSVGIRLGADTLSLRSDGVDVAGQRGAQLNELQERVTALLKGLAGLAWQQNLVRRMRGTGARICR